MFFTSYVIDLFYIRGLISVNCIITLFYTYRTLQKFSNRDSTSLHVRLLGHFTFGAALKSLKVYRFRFRELRSPRWSESRCVCHRRPISNRMNELTKCSVVFTTSWSDRTARGNEIEWPRGREKERDEAEGGKVHGLLRHGAVGGDVETALSSSETTRPKDVTGPRFSRSLSLSFALSLSSSVPSLSLLIPLRFPRNQRSVFQSATVRDPVGSLLFIQPR